MEDPMRLDCVVVGAGIEGSATAYHLAMNGKKTLLIEQFPLPHSRGSSHGQSRIIRIGYHESYFVEMMPECYRLWKQVERENDTELLKKVGLLVMESAPHDSIKVMEKNVKKFGIRYEMLSAEEMKKRYPMFQLSNDYRGFFDSEGGILKADKAMASFQSLFKEYGGIIHDTEKVLDIVPNQSGVTIRTNKSLYRSKAVVLTPGAWASSLLKPLGLQIPFKVVRVSPCYWKEKSPGSFSDQKMPVFIDETDGTYGIPPFEYPNMVKYCLHGGVEVESPEYRDSNLKTKIQTDIDKLKRNMKEKFPMLEGEPSIVEHCMYTATPDGTPILDRHPKFPNIILGVGFSGRGFKLAPVVGKLLYEMVTNKRPSYSLEPFALKRLIPGLTQSHL